LIFSKADSLWVRHSHLHIHSITIDLCNWRVQLNLYINHLKIVLKRCEQCNLVLNWEKCHFMVQHGIAMGHAISSKGIEVDKAKIDIISKLPPPMTAEGVKSFLGHAGFYRRFIKDFSKISRPLYALAKDAKLNGLKNAWLLSTHWKSYSHLHQ
jgi:hypothetical protein